MSLFICSDFSTTHKRFHTVFLLLGPVVGIESLFKVRVEFKVAGCTKPTCDECLFNSSAESIT